MSKNTLTFLVMSLLATVCLVGCTTPYMVDRGRDAADIFTATVGEGSGLKAQAGPLAVGLFGNIDTYGLRGGQINEFVCNGYDGYSMLDFNVRTPYLGGLLLTRKYL